ncbi:MAG: lipoyl synthase [Verrucomicrobiota bacterium]
MSQVEEAPLNRKPSWIRAKIPGGAVYSETMGIVKENKLHTVCESAQCPNLGECWSRKTATIMILGNICTRSCGFCAVNTGKPTELDLDEPRRVAEAVKLMGLKHAVITSVARDDQKDGGALVWKMTIEEIRKVNPGTHIEVLIPDFKGKWEHLETVLSAKPDILNHNVETVPRLHKEVRPQALYARSLEMLDRAKKAGFVTKSGLMLGIGETEPEIETTLRDLAEIKLDILTLGQYLRPSPQHLPVQRWVHPEEFLRWKTLGLDELGFGVVESGPLVRSSYHADEQSSKYASS